MEIMKILPDGMPSAFSMNSFQIEGIPIDSGLARWNGRKGSEVYSIPALNQKIKQVFPKSDLEEWEPAAWFIRRAEESGAADSRVQTILKDIADGLSCLIYALVRQPSECRMQNKLYQSDWKFWKGCRRIYFIGGIFQKQTGAFLVKRINSRLQELRVSKIKADSRFFDFTPSLLGCAQMFSKCAAVYTFDFGSTRMKRAVMIRDGGKEQMREYDAVYKDSGAHQAGGKESALALHRQILSVILDTIKENTEKAPREYYICACLSNNVLEGKIADRGNYCALRLLGENYEQYMKEELEQILERPVHFRLFNDAQAAAVLFRAAAPSAAVVTCGTAMGIAYPKPLYQETDLVRIARRENNRKRNYLVVNPLQGKHIPAEPRLALAMFHQLAGLLKETYANERLLVAGFAETATAIGAAAAVQLNAYYIQTTREAVPDVDYLFFSEEHSHAAEQKLVKEDLDVMIPQVDRILFVEDEVTTGKTILNIIRVLEEQYPGKVSYAVASLLNGMDQESQKVYAGRNIPLHYLVKTDHSSYAKKAEQYAAEKGQDPAAGAAAKTREAPRADRGMEGEYVPCKTECAKQVPEIKIGGWVDARRLVRAEKYEAACEALWQEVYGRLHKELSGRVLVIGTEEFMYPALFIASKIAETAEAARCHATTRSPIAVYCNEEYPLHVRYELISLYDRQRRTFLYDIGKYDTALVVTDAQTNEREGICSLVNALSQKNENIFVIRWC